MGEIEAQVRKLTLMLEKNTQQRKAPERVRGLLEPEEPEAIKA